MGDFDLYSKEIRNLTKLEKSISNTTELEKLIQQAKNGEISWDEEVKLKSDILLKQFIGSISPENWKKIKHKAPGWVNLISQINQSGKLFNSEWKFSSRKILEEFRKYIDINAYPNLETKNRGKIKISEVNENDIVTTSWKKLAVMFRNSHKIFGDDWVSFRSEDALRFLQSIISDEFLQGIAYRAGEKFKLSELKSDTTKSQLAAVESKPLSYKQTTFLGLLTAVSTATAYYYSPNLINSGVNQIDTTNSFSTLEISPFTCPNWNYLAYLEKDRQNNLEEIYFLKGEINRNNGKINKKDSQLETILHKYGQARNNYRAKAVQMEEINEEKVRLAGEVDKLKTAGLTDQEINSLKIQFIGIVSSGIVGFTSHLVAQKFCQSQENEKILQQTVTSSDKKLNESREKLKKTKAKIGELEKEIADKNAEIAELNKQIQELSEKNEKTDHLEKKVVDLTNEVKEKENQLEIKRKELAECEEKNKELETENESLKKSVENYEFLQGKLSSAERQLEETKNSLKTKEEKNVQLEKVNQELKGKAGKFELFLDRRLQDASKKANLVESSESEIKEETSDIEKREKEINESIDELIESDIKLEKAREENSRLENSLKKKFSGDYEELIKEIDKEVSRWEEEKLSEQEIESRSVNFSHSRIISEEKEIKELIQGILKLKWEIKLKEKEIEVLEEKLRKIRWSLQEKIEEKKEELDKATKECAEEIDEERNKSLTGKFKKMWEGDFNKKLEELLKSQEIITRLNDSYFEKEKKKLIESVPNKLTDKLKNLCQLKHELTQLEIQLTNADKVVKVFNIQGIYSEGNVRVEGNFSMENIELQALIESPHKN